MLMSLKSTDIVDPDDNGYSSFFQNASVEHLSSIPFVLDVCEQNCIKVYDVCGLLSLRCL